jgi:hypothetical protein
LPSALRGPLGASVTLWEATAPVKLPASRGPPPGSRVGVRDRPRPEWYFTAGSAAPESAASSPPTYPTQARARPTGKLE